MGDTLGTIMMNWWIDDDDAFMFDALNDQFGLSIDFIMSLLMDNSWINGDMMLHLPLYTA